MVDIDTPGRFLEKVNGTSQKEVFLRGTLTGRTGGIDVYDSTIDLRDWGAALSPDDFLPLAPIVSATLTSRTTSQVTVTPRANNFPRSHLLYYVVYRSTDGAEPVAIGPAITPPLDTPMVWTESGLPVSTAPEKIFTYTVRAYNSDGAGALSNVVSLQWAGVIISQPTAPTGLTFSALGPNSVRLAWNETADASVTKHGIFQGTTLLVDNLSATATFYTWSGLLPSHLYSGISVRRYNGVGSTAPAGWSPASGTVTFTTTSGALSPMFTGHIRGKCYLGWSTSQAEGTASGTAEFQLNNQVPFNPAAGAPTGTNYGSLLGVRRLYNKVSSDISYADSQNRVLWISAKGDEMGASLGVAGWSQIASGSKDAGIISYFTDLVARGKLTIFTFHHEPVGDATDPVGDGTIHCAAHQRIMQVVDANFGGKWNGTSGHKIIFCPNYEENRLRNLKVNGTNIDWSKWLPANMLPGLGGPRPWDFISWDIYQYGADTSTGAKNGVQFSHRWWRIDELFTGTFTPTGTTVMPYMRFIPGVDIVFGIGEGTQRPGAFANFEGNVGTNRSNMTGAKYSRDYLNYVFANIDKFAFLSWFNTIGADIVYNDERLYPGNITWGGDDPQHDYTQQNGDTEYTINIYREKLASGLTVKLAANGLPPP